MNQRKVHFVINPSSGREEPILTFIDSTFKDSDVDWSVSVTKKHGDARNFAQKAYESGVDAVAVYGGDGTVVQVAQALMHTDTPMIVLPGGTANIMAKEILMPTDTRHALQMIKDKTLENRLIDMALCGDTPILIRVNIGFVADMVSQVDPGIKEMFGQLAYGVTAVQHLRQSPIQKYKLTLDGTAHEVKGIAVVVANVCNVGVPGMSFAPGSEISDGVLDVLVLHRIDLPSIISAVGSLMSQQKVSDIYSHWLARDVHITFEHPQSVLCDDSPLDTHSLSITVIPQALQVLCPRV